jgi:diguanylate cyclase (GGDEF)-like protein
VRLRHRRRDGSWVCFEITNHNLLEPDRSALRSALDSVLMHGRHTDVEVQLRLPATRELRFCSISLRALTREDGAINGAIVCVADVTDSLRTRDELKRRATFDELTGCHNRASFMRELEANVAGDGLGLERAAMTERAVMFVDLDRFKELNDRYGHAAGDELLRIFGRRLRETVRGNDLVGRVGGDEFLVMCPDAGGPDGAMRLAERVAESLHERVRLSAGSVSMQVSIGVAWSAGAAVAADALVAQADTAMYQSKRQRCGEPRLAVSKVTDLSAR